MANVIKKIVRKINKQTGSSLCREGLMVNPKG